MTGPALFFSVVICTYNRAGLLKRALTSIAAQTFTDYETLIVDDGSEDETEAVALGEFPTFHYHKRPHQGLGRARDFGLRTAKGQWVAFLDDDDEFLPDHLQVRADLIAGDPSLDMLFNGFKTIGSEQVPDLANAGKFLHVDSPEIFHGGTLCVNREKAVAAGGFQPVYGNLYSDDFMQVAKAANLKMHRVAERTYLYYRQQNSITGSVERDYSRLPG